MFYSYKARIVRVIDGDTFIAEIDRGFGDFSLKTIRLTRINTPEIRGVEKEEGLAAKQFLESLLEECDFHCTIYSQRVDSFGRSLAEVFVERQDKSVNLNDLLVEKGHAKFVDY